MTTWRQAIYMVLDELKLMSDDANFNEEHIMFLLSKCRSLLLSQAYKDLKRPIPDSNYQTVCLDLEQSNTIGSCQEVRLKSKQQIPHILPLGQPKIYIEDFYDSTITYVSKERMKYVGHNKWLRNIIYASIDSNNHLQLTSPNPQFLNIESIRFTGIFEDPENVQDIECNKQEICDPMDRVFPLEDSLIAQAIDTVVKTISLRLMSPENNLNNASDDLSNLYTFLRLNSKSSLQKQIEGDE